MGRTVNGFAEYIIEYAEKKSKREMKRRKLMRGPRRTATLCLQLVGGEEDGARDGAEPLPDQDYDIFWQHLPHHPHGIHLFRAE